MFFLILVLSASYILSRPAKDFSYLKNKNEVTMLAEAFHSIVNKESPTRTPATQENITIADSSYRAFLNINNPYHILLSYKILNKLSVVGDTDSRLITYESNHSITYGDEIEKILQTGNFDKNSAEEIYLINELASLKPEVILEVLESKLTKMITKLNEDDTLDDAAFKNLLTLYIEKLRMNKGSDTLERYKMLDDQITSTKLKKVFNSYWSMPEESSKEAKDINQNDNSENQE